MLLAQCVINTFLKFLHRMPHLCTECHISVQNATFLYRMPHPQDRPEQAVILCLRTRHNKLNPLVYKQFHRMLSPIFPTEDAKDHTTHVQAVPSTSCIPIFSSEDAEQTTQHMYRQFHRPPIFTSEDAEQTTQHMYRQFHPPHAIPHLPQ